ncbi:hypothetical protein [Delftia deserti]|uniref:hypothetical protein n=1 Tax=Delftia deserti TaxID=1651218 RepID=UPI00361DDC86
MYGPKKRCGCHRDPCDITRHCDQPSQRRPKDSHRVVQDEWAKSQGYAKYNSGDAPSILLNRSPNHAAITTQQNASRDARVAAGNGKWSSTIREEFEYSSKDLKAAGVSEKCRKRALKKSYQYFDEI